MQINTLYILTLRRTHKFIPPLWYKGGGGVMEPLPTIFDMFQYFETLLPLVESLWSSQQDELYFMCGGAAGSLWHHQQIRLKLQEMVIFVLDMKNNT